MKREVGWHERERMRKEMLAAVRGKGGRKGERPSGVTT